ncbi:MAG TPA: GNAT family N-acetyltransferase [Chloroflexi bacterium]|nr:GNAT family N-acetyltransferase [Chloroflexota bacterium]
MASFETERLIVRGFSPEDWQDLQEYVSQPDVTRYDYEYPTSDEECRGIAECFSTQEGFWAVCLKETGKMIGHIVCTRKPPDELRTWSLGFVFNPAYGRRGYATEACRRILRHVFEDLDAHRVEAGCAPDNTASWRLLERLSMRREAHHIKSGFIRRAEDGSPLWGDSYIYAILGEEWKTLNAES